MIYRFLYFYFKFAWRCLILSVAILNIFFRILLGLLNEFSSEKEISVLMKRLNNFNTMLDPSHNRKHIKLLKFPLLVQREILRSMRYTDLFTLSLCSSRMYNLIEIWSFKIERLCYREYRNGFWIYNRHNDKQNEYIVFMSFVSKYKHDSDETRATFGGVSIDFLWRPWGIEYIDVSGNFIQSATQKHINKLFKTLDIDLELCSENLERDIYLNIQNATDILFSEYAVTKSSTLEEIIQMHPCRKSIRVESPIDGGVAADSILFQTSEVMMAFCGPLTPLFLNSFEGSLASLRVADYEKNDVIRFVNQWISGERLNNLSALHVYANEMQSDLEMYRNELAPLAKQWNRPKEYEYSTRLIGIDRNIIHSIELLPEQCMDFERETDKKMATFVYTEYCCRLLIWN